MRQVLATFFSQLFCRHEYMEVNTFMINAGLAKGHVLQCRKCGKEKVVT